MKSVPLLAIAATVTAPSTFSVDYVHGTGGRVYGFLVSDDYGLRCSEGAHAVAARSSIFHEQTTSD